MCRWEIQTYGLIIWSPDGRIVCVGGGGDGTGRARHHAVILDAICSYSCWYSACLHLQISSKPVLCCSYCLPTVTFDIMLCLSLATEAQVWFQASHCEFVVYKMAVGQVFFSLNTWFIPCHYFTIAPCGWLGYVRRWQTVVFCLGWGWRNSRALGSGLIWHSTAVWPQFNRRNWCSCL